MTNEEQSAIKRLTYLQIAHALVLMAARLPNTRKDRYDLHHLAQNIQIALGKAQELVANLNPDG